MIGKRRSRRGRVVSVAMVAERELPPCLSFRLYRLPGLPRLHGQAIMVPTARAQPAAKLMRVHGLSAGLTAALAAGEPDLHGQQLRGPSFSIGGPDVFASARSATLTRLR